MLLKIIIRLTEDLDDLIHKATRGFSYKIRGGASTGAAGAFAPVNFQQRVHCTRPDEELSWKWPLASQKRNFFCAKNEVYFSILGLSDGT